MTPPRVTFLDHTADVGFDVRAPDPATLFHDAAHAMLTLLRGEEDEEDGKGPAGAGGRGDRGGPPSHPVALTAPDAPRLLADWLRELLLLHEVERQDYVAADFSALTLDPGPGGHCRLEATIRLRPGGHAIREIKGVTYHEIDARPTDDGWAARVIFDV